MDNRYSYNNPPSVGTQVLDHNGRSCKVSYIKGLGYALVMYPNGIEKEIMINDLRVDFNSVIAKQLVTK